MSKSTHKYYFDVLCAICSGKKTQINTINMIKCLTYNELIEFRQTAMQVLAYCLRFLEKEEKIEVFGILLNELKSSNPKIQEAAYQCLRPCSSEMLLHLNMVNTIYY